MEQDPQERGSGGLSVKQFMGVARRRHLHFLIPLLFGWLAVWAVSWLLPPRYRSGTLILVEQPTMPKDYVVPNVADDLQERLQSITQQILSRTRLLHIIDELNLYAVGHAQLTPDDKVELMRKDIEIELVHDRSNRVTAFNVYYSSRDPHTAQEVTSALTNLFINENLEVRQQQSEGTTNFLEDQLEAARKTLAEQEEKIREFKLQHVGELPAQLETNLQILNGLQAQLRGEGDALNSAKQQRAYLQSLLDQYRALQVSPKAADGAPLGLPAVDEELDKLKAQLSDLSSRYTDRHPDVRKLKEQIVKVEKMRDQILADLKARNSTTKTDAGPDAAAQESADQSTMSAPMVQLQGQLQANQIEIVNRERAIAELKNKITDCQAHLNQEPVREQQLADLARGYDQSKANYDELLKKKNESAMATRMELQQQGERFQILDPPSLPLKPDFPNHLKFCGIGLGVGLALGGLVAGAFEMLDHRVYDEEKLRGLLPIAVLAEIPEVVNPLEEARGRKRLWRGWVAAALVVCAILAGSAFSYFHG
jgi:polysaccharide chain length determinant protein (PEP-CTERM system associated)